MNKLIFLGSGSATNTESQMTSLCFVIGDNAFLIDCGDGMGTVRQFLKAGVQLSQINDIFVTHDHADHIIGMPHLLFLKMILEKNLIVNVYGPSRALRTVRSITFQTHGIKRYENQRLFYKTLHAGEKVNLFGSATVVSSKVKSPHSTDTSCFAYAVTMGGKKVVFSADMEPNKNFDGLAKDADILIHECFATREEENFAHKAGHSTAKDAGIAAQKARAKRLILTHFRPASDIGNGGQYISEAKKYYNGPIVLARDLMEVLL